MKKAVVAILLVFLAAGCTDASSSFMKTSLLPGADTSSSSTSSVNLDHSYSNTADDYSYKYPDGYIVQGTNDYGSSATITPTAAASNVQQNNSTNIIFSVTEEPNLPDLSEASIQQYLTGAYVNAADYTISPAEVAGVSGFKVSDDIAADSVAADFYYIQKGSGNTLELVVQKDNPTASAIFNSFSF